MMLAISLAACSDGVSATRAPSILFSITAQDVTIAMDDESTGSLTLAASTSILWFSDRPGRAAGTMTVQDLVDGWVTNGFETDPPNAAVVVTTTEATTQHVVTLDTPRSSGSTVSFTFSINPDGEESGYAHLHDMRSGTFERVELFIDDAALPECPTYLTGKSHSIFKCLITPNAKWEATYQFDPVGLTGTFQFCATQPGLSAIEDWNIPYCPQQFTLPIADPWNGSIDAVISGPEPVMVTATFHGKAKAPKRTFTNGGNGGNGGDGSYGEEPPE